MKAILLVLVIGVFSQAGLVLADTFEDFKLKNLQKEYYQSQIDRNNLERRRALSDAFGRGHGLAVSNDYKENNSELSGQSSLNRIIRS